MPGQDNPLLAPLHLPGTDTGAMLSRVSPAGGAAPRPEEKASVIQDKKSETSPVSARSGERRRLDGTAHVSRYCWKQWLGLGFVFFFNLQKFSPDFSSSSGHRGPQRASQLTSTAAPALPPRPLQNAMRARYINLISRAPLSAWQMATLIRDLFS